MLAGNMFLNYMFHAVNPITNEMDFYSLYQGNNIFLTLAVYLLILKLLQMVKSNYGGKRYTAILGIIVLSVLSIPFCEGSLYLLTLLFLFYFGYGKKKAAYIGITLWSLLLLLKALMSYFSGGTGISLYSTLCFSSEWAMLTTVLPIYLYSGERGNNTTFFKWMFYIIYPAHIWILRILLEFIG